ncbi:MAG: SEL1-like repeat protein [Alphaproteobacteria bacterium]
MIARVSNLVLLGACLALPLAACGKSEQAATPTAEAVVPSQADLDAKKQADQKAAFVAALKSNDAVKMEDLANTGNGFALLHRAQTLMASQDFNSHESGVSDMETAAEAGNAEAQLWVGSRMAEGTDGYSLKPNSGIIMVEKAANQGLGPAMLELGRLYQTSLMRDPRKSRDWYQKAADANVEGAKDALAEFDKAASDAAP